MRGLSGRGVRREVAAGLTVWAAAVPSGLAYAGLAGLPPVVGLYASAIAGLAYLFVGSVRQAQVGPTSTSSILTAAAIAPLATGEIGHATALAAMLAVEVGVILLVARTLRLAFLADLLSRPVLIGFTAAISLVIIAAQLPSLLGLTGVSTRTFGRNIDGVLDRAGHIDVTALTIGVASLVTLIVLRRLLPRWPRELLVMVIATLIVAVFGLSGSIHVVGNVPGGLPAPSLPSVRWADITHLLPAAAGIALIAFTETMAIGRTMGRRRRYEVAPARELVALGVANLAAGVFQGYPGNASFAQSGLGDGAGARTPLSALTTKIAILATLLVLTPLFTNVPYAVLAAIVVSAVLGFIDLPGFRQLLRFQRSAQGSHGQPGRWVSQQPEFWSALVTFSGTLLFGILNGIFIGVLATLLAVLFRASRPRIAVLGKVHGAARHRDISRHPEAKTRAGVLIVRLEAELFFANADYFRQTVLGLVQAHDPPPDTVVIVGDAMSQVDLTGLETLGDLVNDLHEAGVEVRFCRVKGPVHDAFSAFGIVDLVGSQNFYDSVRAAKKGLEPDGLPMFSLPASSAEAADLEWSQDAGEVTRSAAAARAAKAAAKAAKHAKQAGSTTASTRTTQTTGPTATGRRPSAGHDAGRGPWLGCTACGPWSSRS